MIAEIEDAIIDRIKALNLPLRGVATVPASFGESELEARVRMAPGAYVAFIGAQARGGTDELTLDGTFAVFVLTSTGNEEQRRRGVVTAQESGPPLRQGGAYALMEMIAPALHGVTLGADAGGGTLIAKDIANMFAPTLDSGGFSLYSATFSIQMPFATATPADLAAFRTLHADWLFGKEPAAGTAIPLDPPGTDSNHAADSADTVSLPQGEG